MQMISLARSTFDSLGLIINEQKSTTVPTQNIKFIGAVLDSMTARAYLPLDRFQAIQELVKVLDIAPTVSIHTCLHLLGNMASTTFMVPHARLHFRDLQYWLGRVYLLQKHSIHRTVTVPPHVRDSLRWWGNTGNILSGIPFRRPQLSVLITTDPSLIGWGAHMGNDRVQDKWSSIEKTYDINLLELRAISLACKHFLPCIRHTTVRIFTDNVAAMYYVNRQGGARSCSLCAEAIRLWNWCIKNGVTITASYLPGISNVIADSLSRRFPVDHEWEMRCRISDLIFHRWHMPRVDLFATAQNAKCPQFCSRAGRCSSYHLAHIASLCISPGCPGG
nr:uncharacterized protein LOC102444972 [Pelodiscus sinensis]|eukprot:XP_006116545.1 uncharacterized protein LOC102444972 [Pelodiscus sinensis]